MRNFGISFEKVSSRTAHGEVMPSGPHIAGGASRDPNVISLADRDSPCDWPNLGSDVAPSFIVLDLGAALLWAAVLSVPWLFVWAVVFFGMALFDFG